MNRFLAELRRRRVWRVAAAYAVVAWLIVEVVNTVFPRLLLPDWAVTAVIVAALAGFPIALILAWSFDVVPDGEAARLRRPARRGLGLLLSAGILAMVAATSSRLFDRVTRDALLLDSIVVLPFDNLSGDADQEYFVAGMHDALISELSQIDALRRVISRRSALRYQTSDMSLPEIARELDVGGVVEGSVTRSADGVQIRVRLIRTQPREEQIWTQSFTRDVREVLVMHGEIARSIAGAIRVRLTPELTLRLQDAPVVNPEVYDAYLRGMFHVLKGPPREVEVGLRHLHRAVELNPGDALAYAGLALGYTSLAHSADPPDDAWPRARQAALRSVRLDPGLAEAHAALAHIRLYHEWDWEGAGASFERANQLNPHLALNQYHYAWYLALVDRMDEAVVAHQRAKELDPLTPQMTADLGSLYISLGRYDDAIREARTALELNPTALHGFMLLAEAYLMKGMHGEAIAEAERLVEITPAGRWVLGRMYAAAGRRDDARRIIAELEAQRPRAWTNFGLAVIYATLGDADRTFELLETPPLHAWIPWVRMLSWFEHVHADPRMNALMQRMRLPPAAALPMRTS